MVDLPRPRRRLTELLVKTANGEGKDEDKQRWAEASKEWSLKFLRSPLVILSNTNRSKVEAIRLGINRLEVHVGLLNPSFYCANISNVLSTRGENRNV